MGGIRNAARLDLIALYYVASRVVATVARLPEKICINNEKNLSRYLATKVHDRRSSTRTTAAWPQNGMEPKLTKICYEINARLRIHEIFFDENSGPFS